MGPAVLEDLLQGVELPSDPRLLVGFDKFDDAGVFLLQEDLALIQTVDFFTPMVDDGYTFGQVAAANALSDIYAMGGQPLTAMNVVCFPSCEDQGILREILRGGLDKIREAGAVLVGGHTVDDNEPKYGLAVTGVISPARLIRNDAVQPGDVILLTKPLGSGIIATAIKAGMASASATSEAVKWMSMLNKAARNAAVEAGVRAGTDVTGFGLLGHLFEMARGSGVTIEIDASRLSFMSEARECASWGLIPGGAYSNRDYLGERIFFAESIDTVVKDLMYSPETSGGLLLAISEERCDTLVKTLEKHGVAYAIIGQATKPGPYPVLVKGGS